MAKTAKKKTATAKKKSARKPNAAFMKPVSAEPRAGSGDRGQGGAADRGDQEAVGLHQEERAAGSEEPPDDQRRRRVEAGLWRQGSVNMFEMTKLVGKHLK